MGGGASTNKVNPDDAPNRPVFTEDSSASSTDVVKVLPRKASFSNPSRAPADGSFSSVLPAERGRSKEKALSTDDSPSAQRPSQSSPPSASTPLTKSRSIGLGGNSHESRTIGGRGDRGDLQPGQRVKLHSLVSAPHLNGQEATLLLWDQASSRWLIRLTNGEEKRVKGSNLKAASWNGVSGPTESSNSLSQGRPVGGFHRAGSSSWVEGNGADDAEEANRQLEALLLQSNWSAIYQLFHSRFGIAALDKLDKGQVVKASVEMTLSIVAKCFALLRSDPSGRLHCTPLHIAALQSSQEATEVIVHEMPQMVQQTHLPSHTALCPLHIAILCGAYPVAELLLDARANPNVRTLHDVCPIHIAAATSREMCQLLLSYRSDPQKRDVMGSSSVHYAAAFKRGDALDVLLNSPAGPSLARDVDQKRVSPLHIGCALHHDDSDLHGLMQLLAHGAKPWQADVHGAPARELLPASGATRFLQAFFELHGDQTKSPAQAWLEEAVAASNAVEGMQPTSSSGRKAPTNASENSPVTTAGSTHAEAGGVEPTLSAGSASSEGSQGSSAAATHRESQFGRLGAAGGTAIANRIAELMEEAAQLKRELKQSREQCVALQQERGELEHFRSKCQLLEEAAVNQRKVFEDLQNLHEAETVAHRDQLETLNRRHKIEMEDLQATLLLQLEAARVEAQEERRNTKQKVGIAQAATIEDLRQQLEAAKAQAEVIQQTSKAEATSKKKDEASLQKGLEVLLRKHHVQPSNGPAADGHIPKESLLKALDEELSRLQQLSAHSRDDAEALRGQVQQRHEEAATLTRTINELRETCRRLESDAKDRENRASAEYLKLEMQLKERELQHSHAIAALQAEAAGTSGRIEEVETANRLLEGKLEGAMAEVQRLGDAFLEEQKLRKKFHNQIQDMKGAIRVYCRVRPLNAREAGELPALRKADGFSVTLSRPGPGGETKSFGFDSVFDSDSTQDDVFSECKDLVQSAVDGYNVTIFAYGQTGAGKTHTMYGSREEPGLATRSIQTVFEVVEREQQRGGKSYRVKTYIVEIYKQDILDLLTDKPPAGKDKKGLEVRKDLGRGMMYVEGVTEVTVTSPEELMSVLAEAEKRRHVASTKMNSASSRSHLLLSIVIECNDKDTNQVLYGKITLCDLAGSERPKKSEVSGEGLKEAIEINKSLSALGDVIEALTKGSKSIPYRNHKLTMLMQDSLGGSAKTLMFVNCSPAGSNFEETTMSLKWATRARQVTNEVKRNADSKEVARLKQVIAMMSAAQNAESILDASGPEAPNLQDTKRDLQLAMNATLRN